MKLSLLKAHKSIVQLDAEELPEFVVLSGLNGSGKTQLLEAIEQGYVLVDGEKLDAPPPQPRPYRRFDFTNLVPNASQGSIVMSEQGKRRADMWNQYCTLRAGAWKSYSPPINLGGLSIEQLPDEYLKLSPLDLTIVRRFENDRAASELLSLIDIHVANAISQAVRAAGRNNPNQLLVGALEQISKGAGKPIQQLIESDFFLYMPVAPSVQEPFQQSFNQLFGGYSATREENRYRRYQRDSNEGSKPCYSEEQFTAYFGRPPWETLNRIFESARLNFRAAEPPSDLFSNYSAKLIEQRTGRLLDFNDLSSGERIIAAFALCMYYAEDKTQAIRYPKMLLFDEIDAPLHPSMTQALLTTIQDVLVRQSSIKVILTTHSPTTVALAPESSLFVIRRTDSTVVEKATKDQLLSVLTGDIPTLSIDYENRRQAFVESWSDAETFEFIFQTLKSKIGSPRSLSFIAVDPAYNADGGCDRLKAIVASLRSGGNSKICGIVDYDNNAHAQQDGIYILTGRDAIENWTLDPLLLGAFLLKSQIATTKELGLPEDMTFVKLAGADVATLRKLAESTWKICGFECSQELTSQSYVGGFELEIPNSYCVLDGHALQNQITEKLPGLSAITKNRTPLFPHVIRAVAKEYTDFLPKAFVDLFASILEP